MHSHSALTLCSRSEDHPARRLAPGEVCPEWNRYDGWFSRTFLCAIPSVSTRHGGRQQSAERWCARCFVLVSFADRPPSLPRGERAVLMAADARTPRNCRTAGATVYLSRSLSLSLCWRRLLLSAAWKKTQRDVCFMLQLESFLAVADACLLVLLAILTHDGKTWKEGARRDTRYWEGLSARMYVRKALCFECHS